MDIKERRNTLQKERSKLEIAIHRIDGAIAILNEQEKEEIEKTKLSLVKPEKKYTKKATNSKDAKDKKK